MRFAEALAEVGVDGTGEDILRRMGQDKGEVFAAVAALRGLPAGAGAPHARDL